VPISPQLTGFSPESRDHGPVLRPAEPRCVGGEWMSDELMADTRRVWSVAYGRVISTDEAVEILNNVKRLADVMLRAQREGKQP
jgi:hypothetical protein